jgi:hypothetical protein
MKFICFCFLIDLFDIDRNPLYLILVISGLCTFGIAGLLCVLDLSKVKTTF